MTKTTSLLTALGILALAVPAFADDTPSTTSETKVESDDNGNYDKTTTTENTNAAGTTSKHKTKTKVKHSSNGSVKKTTDSENSTDPKGMMNKTTSSSNTTEEQNADGSTSYHHKKKVNGDTVEDDKTETNQ